MYASEVHGHEAYVQQIYQVANVPVFWSLKKEIYRRRVLSGRSDGVELEYCTLTSTAVAKSGKGKFEAEHVGVTEGDDSPVESILRLTFGHLVLTRVRQ